MLTAEGNTRSRNLCYAIEMKISEAADDLLNSERNQRFETFTLIVCVDVK